MKKQIDINRTSYVIVFILCLSLLSGILLASLNFILNPLKEQAVTFDKNKQMLMSVSILNDNGCFQLRTKNGFVPATFDPSSGILKDSNSFSKVSAGTLEQYSKLFVRPLFTDKTGKIFSPEELNINISEFEKNFSDSHYYLQPHLLFYAVLKNDAAVAKLSNKEIIANPEVFSAIIIPISGFGLWGPIYGFLGLLNDGNTVLGTTWYRQGETPGLGANISNPSWQQQFFGKKVFLANSEGEVDYVHTRLGIEVVKGKSSVLYGNSPEAYSSVDGISGATLTCNGVTEAYERSLKPYRGLLLFFNNLNKDS